MARWFFTKDGKIRYDDKEFTIDELIRAIDNAGSFIISIGSDQIGETLKHNDVVYIDQSTGLIHKSFNTLTPNQKQNAYGVYRFENDKHTVVVQGIVKNFGTNLIPGRIYNLSKTPGKVTDERQYSSVVIGRAMSTTDLLVEIKGETNILPQVSYDTAVVHPESQFGVKLTDPTESMSVRFNKKTYDNSLPPSIMFFKADDLDGKLDVANEYFGDVFTVELKGSLYEGTFKANDQFSNPTVLTLVGGEVTPPAPLPTISVQNFVVDPDNKRLSGVATNAEEIDIVIKDPSDTEVFSKTFSGTTSWAITSSELPVFNSGIMYTVTATATNVDDATATSTAQDSYTESVPVADPTVNIVTFEVHPDTKALSGTCASTKTIIIKVEDESQSAVFNKTINNNTSTTWTIAKNELPDFDPDVTYKATVTVKNSENAEAVVTDTSSYVEAVVPTYNTVITHEESKKGITLTNPDDNMSLGFDEKSFDQTQPPSIMFFRAGDTIGKVDVANEYLNAPFSVTIGDDVYKGVFIVNETFDTPTVLSK